MPAVLPQTWFADQQWFLLLIFTVIAMVALIKGADWLVEGASGLAYRFGMPKIIVGATIVSLGTTSPECAVSVMAAWGGEPGLALGNAVGSIIADTALIFGVGCVITVLPADRFVLSRQGWVQFGSALLLAGLCYFAFAQQGDAAQIDRWMGIVLLGLLAGYMFISVKWARQHKFGEPFIEPNGDAETTDETESTKHEDSLAMLIGMIVLGLAIVIVSSDALVQSVGELAFQWGVPKVVIAATLVAFGTSLPELVVGITSIRKGHAELLVGNVIGADVLNVLFVIGASAVAKPLPVIDQSAKVPEIFLYLHLPAMLVILLLFRGFIFSAVKKEKFSRWMGWPLLALYVAYSVSQYVISVGK